MIIDKIYIFVRKFRNGQSVGSGRKTDTWSTCAEISRKVMKTNLTVLRYIVAVDTYRNFVKAAEACGVTQPTLSIAIRNMEEELDVTVFNRNSHPVRPTPLGEKIIAMARATLRSASQIEELVMAEKGEVGGEVFIGTIPTVAPYVLPGLIREMRALHPEVRLKVSEMRTGVLVDKLRSGEVDMAIMSTPLGEKDLLEIPLYYEKFLAYISPEDEFHGKEEILADELPTDRLWILEEGHCLRSQVLNFCHSGKRMHSEYQAGSIDSLVRVVDCNGGYTVVPELHAPFLGESRQRNLRPITGRSSGQPCEACVPVREVSIVIHEDFVREKLLNSVAECIRRIVPENMLDTRLKRFAIKL